MNLRNAIATTHVAAAGVWLGVILTIGLVAALTFPTLKELAPTLPEVSPDISDQWRLLGGYLTNPLFGVLRVAQWIGLAICIVTLVLSLERRSGRAMTAVRILLLASILGLLAFDQFVLAPRMESNLDAFRTAAIAGDIQTAQTHRDAFDGDHPLASRILMTDAALVAGVLVTGVLASARVSGGRAR